MEITVNGVRLYYEVHGSGRPLILLHGNGENHGIFDALVPGLAGSCTVYTPDSRCHGLSQDTPEITYDLMAKDMIALIRALRLERPLLYGFSDGGIVGLLMALQQPELLSGLIISGANLYPEGLKVSALEGMRRVWRETGDKLYGLMCREPQIDPVQLKQLRIPVHVLAGERDLVQRQHTELIASHIPLSTLEILPGEDHSSYVIHSDRLLPILTQYL